MQVVQEEEMSSKTIIKGLFATIKMKYPQEKLLMDSLSQHFDELVLDHEEEITVLEEKVTDMRAVNECLSSLLHDESDEKDVENDGFLSKNGKNDEIDNHLSMKL